VMIFQTITSKHEQTVLELDGAQTSNVGLRSPEIEDDRFPTLRFVEGSLDGDGSCWFVPNTQAVVAMLRSSGFIPTQFAFANEHDMIVQCTVDR
jgi:hypothetical protein